jgi:hypothetical protein
MSEPINQNPQGYQTPPPGYQAPPPGYQAPPPGFQPQQAYTPQQDAQANKVFAVLAYLGILVLVPIFAAKDSRFARYHANQGLILAIAGIVYGIAYSILSGVLFGVAAASGSVTVFGIVTLVIGILGFAFLIYVVFAILGIVNAAKGVEKPLPLIGGITILK